MPRKINEAVKERAVRLVLDNLSEYPTMTAACHAAAKRCNVGPESVRRWVRQAQVDAGDRPGMSTEEHAEIKRLKAENRRLREDVEILQAATTFFAGALDPRSR